MATVRAGKRGRHARQPSSSVSKRELRRRMATDKAAAFIDALNLEDEYGDPAQKGGHVYRTFHGRSLQNGENVRRHLCCWFRQDAGAGWSSPKWSKVYITDIRLLIQLSGGALVSVWWQPSLRFDADLTVGRVKLDDGDRIILLSGTQIAVLAVACVYMLDSQGPRHPSLNELR